MIGYDEERDLLPLDHLRLVRHGLLHVGHLALEVAAKFGNALVRLFLDTLQRALEIANATFMRFGVRVGLVLCEEEDTAEDRPNCGQDAGKID